MDRRSCRKVFEERCPKMTNPVGPHFIQRQLDPATLGIIRQMMELLLETLAARRAREDFYQGMSVSLRDAKPLETRITRDDITVALANFRWWCRRACPWGSFLVMEEAGEAIVLGG